VNDNKYKVKYTVPTLDKNQADVDVCVRMMQVDDEGKICVEFSNTNENNHDFLEHYNDMVGNILKFSNNAQHEAEIF